MENWIQVIPKEGKGNGEVEIICKNNDSTEDRTTTVDVQTSTLNKTLSITQKGIDMNKIVFEFPNYGAYTGLEIKVNGVIKTAKSFTDWFNKLVSIEDVDIKVKRKSNSGSRQMSNQFYIVNYSAVQFVITFALENISNTGIEYLTILVHGLDNSYETYQKNILYSK